MSLLPPSSARRLPVGGVATVVFGDTDPSVRLTATASKSYWVVATLEADASAQAQNQFRIQHLAASAAADQIGAVIDEVALAIETPAEPTSRVVTAFSPDTDLDGLTDADEATLGTNPALPDHDSDGLLDGIEVALGLDPFTNSAAVDTDGDLLTDLAEVTVHGTNPLLFDRGRRRIQ